jgi:hypothetical protein
MQIKKYGICQGYGTVSVPNRIEDILERDTDRPIQVTLILNKEELKKLLELKKELDKQ